MWRVIVIVVLTGCYTDPNFDATRFRCDDAHACPPGQVCVGGRCSGSAPVDDAPASQVGVACMGTVCGSGTECCVDFVAGPRCIQIGAACTGFTARCDGVEDCGGNVCCADGTNVECRSTTCTRAACLDDDDCKDPNARTCCLGVTPGVPWGDCLSVCP